jgi:NDP-sugar pyrophosphorylase family protein
MKHFKRRFDGRKITYVFQKKMNGTGGALYTAKSILKRRFLVMNGDDLYVKKDLEELTKYDLAVLGYEVKDVSKYGVIKTDGRGNMVDIVEKPKRSKDKLINTGAFMLDKEFFEYELASIGGGEFGLPQTLAKMARDYKVKVKKARDWFPVGNPEDYKKAEEVINKFI